LQNAKSRVQRLVAAKQAHDDVLDELYLAALSRLPSDAERQASRELLAESASSAEFYQDFALGLNEFKAVLVCAVMLA
jgi:hypothetical protein